MRIDDRFMTIITAIVLIVAVGALVQGNGEGESILGPSKKFTAVEDAFIIPAGKVQQLDVLSNDKNVERIVTADLAIINAPICGNARPFNGKIEFVGQQSCAGTVAFTYCISSEEECEPAIVTLDIRELTAGTSGAIVAERVEPAQEEEIEVANIPQVADQPEPLVMPSNDDIVEPDDAVAEIRNLPGSSPEAEVASNLDTNDNISTEPALAAPVEISSTEMGTPTFGGQENDIQLATNSTAPSLNTSPLGLGSAQVPEVVETGPAAQLHVDGQARIAPAPEESGILASIAQSNTLIGATFSVAKSLLEPNAAADPIAAASPVVSPGQTQATIIDGSELAVGLVEEDSAAIPLPQAERSFAQVERPTIEAALTVDTDIASIDTTPAAVPVKTVDPTPEPEREPVQSAIQFIPVETAPVETAPAAITSSRSGDEPALVFIQPNEPVVTAPEPVEEVEELETAAVTPRETVTPQPTPTTAIAGDCEADMQLSAVPGAEVTVAIAAPCRAGQLFRISHEALEFNALLDDNGEAKVTFPVFATQAKVEVSFVDGAKVSDEVEVSDLFRFNRVAIVWDSPVDLNLHAYEYGAGDNDGGHIWSGNPADFRSARRVGGGYMVTLGQDSLLAGPKAEVYSVPISARTKDGLIELSLEVADQGGFCNDRVEIRSLRTNEANLSIDPSVQLSVGDCGTSTKLVVEDAIEDLRIARN